MSQIAIMDFLDAHTGEHFTGKDIEDQFKSSFSSVGVFRKLKQICKRDEYECILTNITSKGRLTAVYGRRKE